MMPWSQEPAENLGQCEPSCSDGTPPASERMLEKRRKREWVGSGPLQYVREDQAAAFEH